jgi:hypothetical protein
VLAPIPRASVNAAPAVNPFLHLRHSSKLPPRGEMSFFGRHTLGYESLRQHFEVNRGLVVKVSIRLAVANHSKESREKHTKHRC